MSILLWVLVFVGALWLLLKASDWFVESAEEIGLSIGISPFVIGMTFVALGTSLPELASSVAAVLKGADDIVIGNVIGSNVANILLVLSISTIIGGTILIKQKLLSPEILIFVLSAAF